MWTHGDNLWPDFHEIICEYLGQMIRSKFGKPLDLLSSTTLRTKYYIFIINTGGKIDNTMYVSN